VNIYEFGPIAATLDGAYAVFVSIATFLEPVAGSSSAALAVVVLTLLVRAALIPVGVAQMRADAVRRRIAPQVAELRRRYRADPQLLQRKMLDLYAQEKASPVAGCLPLLAQAPVLSIVYGLFILPTISGQTNMLLADSVFGVPLGSALAHVAVTGLLTWATAWPFLATMAGIAVIAQASRTVLIAASRDATISSANNEPGATAPGSAAVVRALSFAPFITAVVAAFVPLAAAIYLLVTVTWTLVERAVLRRVIGQ
jgi:YidC/Oxa1 family membrane protein insertase